MTHDEILEFRSKLLDRRKAILDRVQQLEGGWQDLGEREIELEEEAQKASITVAYDQLDMQGKTEIEQIDLALSKLALGEYGICESCGDEIAPKRLEALPWARLCVECARDYEKKGTPLPPAREVVRSAKLPDDYQGLPTGQIVEMVYDQLRTNGRMDTAELKISIRNGVLYLDGTIPSEPERQILIQTLTDVMGFSAVVDHLELTELPWERSDRAPGTRSRPATLEDKLFYDQEDLTEDLFVARNDETPYSPPEEPVPFQE